MAAYSSADHPLVAAVAFDPSAPAERAGDFIWMSKGTSNAYVVASDTGDVIVNTGTVPQGVRARQRFEEALGRPLNVTHIVLTQNHGDHIGGWPVFTGPGVKTYAQSAFPHLLKERSDLAGFFAQRSRAVLHGIIPKAASPTAPPMPPAAEPTGVITFDDFLAFEAGGRRYELWSAPSGETLDSIHVRMPDEGIVFTGNWMGALYGALPHFYTLRGDRDRSVPAFMRELERLIAWEPTVLITGHDDPIVGADVIKTDMTRLLRAVRHIHDETVAGMGAGRTLGQLMNEIALPADLAMKPGRGPVSWYVRAVYEEYTGWFRQEATTELYGTPASSIWAELADLAGGPDVLADRARARLAAGAPVEALHFIDIALARDPKNRKAREAEIAAHEALIAATGGRTFDEIGWLETKIAQARAALA